MTETTRESLIPLVLSLIGLATLAAACSIALLPYEIYRRARSRLAPPEPA